MCCRWVTHMAILSLLSVGIGGGGAGVAAGTRGDYSSDWVVVFEPGVCRLWYLKCKVAWCYRTLPLEIALRAATQAKRSSVVD